jgi:Ni,Fe-hydrogenase maturation factor
MDTLVIAIGNSLRRDDGVAHRVLDLLGDCPATGRAVLQLTPEMCEEIADYERVIFIDADSGGSDLNVLDANRAGDSSSRPRLEPVVTNTTACSPLGHSFAAAEIVALSRSLYDFVGEAFLCHIPVRDFSQGEGLTPQAETSAQEAAGLLREILHRRM